MVRKFEQPTAEEIENRRRMYQQAEELGIDLMGFDVEPSESSQRKDIRKAVVLLATGKEIPEDLRNRLISRMSPATSV